MRVKLSHIYSHNCYAGLVMKQSIIGCLADDFTGATDLASVLAAVGRRTTVVFDWRAVDREALADCEAIVIALKNRTASRDEAVASSLDAVAALNSFGADRIYFKYCSTFDSTAEGNIGPVIEALMYATGARTALVAPSYPRNARTVYQGHLFVAHDPLDESPMRHHPLTPMRDSSLRRLLTPQTSMPIDNLYLDEIHQGGAAIAQALRPHDQADRRIVIADAITDDDLRTLAAASGEHVLLTGGAGLALGLPAETAAVTHRTEGPSGAASRGRRLIVSGSASETTCAQVMHARAIMPSLKLDPEGFRARDDYVVALADQVVSHWTRSPDEPVLVYATDSLADLTRPDRLAPDDVEAILGRLTVHLADQGLEAVIVAGGETSGRVVSDLGISAIRLGAAIAPGVSWAEATVGDKRLFLALKSGNFGGIDMFSSAWKGLG